MHARLATLVYFLAVCGAALAQPYPSKPIRWVVAFAPGGPTDVVSRVIAPKLSERLGQPVVIENRTGAGGNIAADTVAKAAPDGYTVLYVVPALVTNPFMIKGSPDPGSFIPVSQVATISMVLLASNRFPAGSVGEVVGQIRSNPGKVSCGAPGSVPTIGCELLRSHVQTDMIIVNYRGNAPALNALMSGEIDLLFDVASNALPQVKAGRARALASTNPQRGMGPFPDLPTVGETIRGFDLVTWHGVVAPAGTPADIVSRLSREIAATLRSPEVRDRLIQMGVEPVGSSVEAFDAVLRRDSERYGKAFVAAGIKPE
jgi:tripartite-type tricarboxylate transporter receptor subunit TctC